MTMFRSQPWDRPTARVGLKFAAGRLNESFRVGWPAGLAAAAWVGAGFVASATGLKASAGLATSAGLVTATAGLGASVGWVASVGLVGAGVGGGVAAHAPSRTAPIAPVLV